MAVIAGFIPNAEGRAALQAAIDESKRRNARLIVVVYTLRGESDHLEGALAEAHGIAAAAEVDAEVRPVSGEDIAEEILQLASEVHAELIVIGLRRRSITGKLILGSNAQRILLDSATPVLAIKSTR